MSLRIFLLVLLGAAVISGCVRLAGSAGYWKKGAQDKAPEYHGAGFDTQRLTER